MFGDSHDYIQEKKTSLRNYSAFFTLGLHSDRLGDAAGWHEDSDFLFGDHHHSFRVLRRRRFRTHRPSTPRAILGRGVDRRSRELRADSLRACI